MLNPDSVRKYRIWLAERMAKEILDDDKHAKKEVELSFYQKMKKKRKIESNPPVDIWKSSYLPVGALQCHSADAVNGQSTQIWNLSFEVSFSWKLRRIEILNKSNFCSDSNF